MHAAGAPFFGAAPPGGPIRACIGRAPMGNRADTEPGRDWPGWYIEDRVRPYLAMARDAGELTTAEVSVIETACEAVPDVAGPPVPPARLHGDLWSGNVLFSGGQVWLIDPAAHGGHTPRPTWRC